MKVYPHGRRAGVLTCAAGVLLLLGGCTAGPEPADGTQVPTASAAASPSSTAASALPEASAGAPAPDAVPPGAQPPAGPDPVSLSIPSTGTQSPLLQLGLRDDGSLEVPPEQPGSPAGWYTGSPAPGDRGPAVLLGHVNATGGGPGVFAELRSLRPGDRITIEREDGSTAVFAVERAVQYGKAEFPTLEVYGNTDTPELRLITCDGFDAATGQFDDNYVVYAALVP